MKNKEITIYELLGLIKDGKAPKKISYLGTVYDFQHQDYKCLPDDIYLFSEEIKDITDILSDNIEILDEIDDELEDKSKINNEFEDIGEITLIPENTIVTAYDVTQTEAINQLIKNQKKIINEINKLK
jgi:hypothetical protein